MSWFEVDKEGLRAVCARRGKALVVLELVSNALDEPATDIAVTIEPVPRSPRVRVRVTDNAPGWLHLAEAYTLFAPSKKRPDPEKRGRFNLGEKLVFAFAKEGSIISTSGTVIFKKDGTRQRSGNSTARGTCVDLKLEMSRAEMKELMDAARSVIVPPGIRLTVNGEDVVPRTPMGATSAKLMTEVGTSELRRTRRVTQIDLYECPEDRWAMLFEMGIPVCEIDCAWDVDVKQRVPLNLERDGVPASFLRALYAAALDEAVSDLSEAEAAAPWVTEALDHGTSDETLKTVLHARFGERAVIADPSNREATKIAIEEGRQVVSGGALPKGVWNRVKDSGALLPAGRVIPTGVELSPDGEPPIPEEKWSGAMRTVADYARAIGKFVACESIAISYYSVASDKAAWFGGRTLSFNLGCLGKNWPGKVSQVDLDHLLIHELAHYWEKEHLTTAFHERCCRIGAVLRDCPHRLEAFTGR